MILIKISDIDLLKALYVENDYPSDRLCGRRQCLEAFTMEFNQRTGAEHTPEVVGETLVHLRKLGELPRIGRTFSGPRFIAA